MSSQQSRVVTFLFTDIEGSTRRWETDADTMQVALEAHDETLRQAIARCDGRLSSTPAMESAWSSDLRTPRSTPPSRPYGAWSCPCAWASRRARPKSAVR